MSPANTYNYSNGDASIAGAAAAVTAGNDLLSYGNEVLFAPLGFKNVEWWFRDKAGRYPGGWGLRLRAIDMAKFGQLYLQKGRWQDKTIIDAGFIRDAWKPSPAASHYGLFWWRWVREDPGIGPVHFANGFKGQRIFVLPKHGIIIATSANISHADAGETCPALVRAVVSAVQSNGPINQSTSDANRLAEELRLPFSGKPGNSLSKTGQDVPQLSKIGPRLLWTESLCVRTHAGGRLAGTAELPSISAGTVAPQRTEQADQGLTCNVTSSYSTRSQTFDTRTSTAISRRLESCGDRQAIANYIRDLRSIDAGPRLKSKTHRFSNSM